MSSINKFLKKLSLVSGLTLISRILGFLRDIVQTYSLGANLISDAFEAAKTLPSVVRKFTSEGLFNTAFIPIYSKIKNSKGEEEANKWASSIILKIAISTLLITILFQLLMEYFTSILYSGFANKANWTLLNSLSRIFFLTLVSSGLCSIMSTIWTAKHKFALASSGSIISNLTFMILSLYDTSVYWLAFSIMISTYVQLIIVFIPFRSKISWNIRYKTSYNKHFIKLLIPLSLTALIFQILTIIGGWFGSWLPAGQLTYIVKADRLIQLPITLIGIAMSTVLLPTLTQAKKEDKAQYTLLSVKLSIILSSIICATLYSFSDSISYYAFSYGRMTISDSLQISKILQIYTFCLPAWIILKVWNSVLSSKHNTILPLTGNIIHLIMYISISFALLSTYNMYGLAYASLISVWCNLVFITYQIKRKTDVLDSYKLGLILKPILFFLINIFIYTLSNNFISNIYIFAIFSLNSALYILYEIKKIK